MKIVKFQGKYVELKQQGFFRQKLFADNRTFYILQAEGDVIDNALFIARSGNLIRDFIRSHLDLSGIAMAKEYFRQHGKVCDIDDLDEEYLREKVNHSAAFIDSIADGLCECVTEDHLYKNYAGIDCVKFQYDLRTLRFSPSPVWRGGLFDVNRPITPRHIRNISLSKEALNYSAA